MDAGRVVIRARPVGARFADIEVGVERPTRLVERLQGLAPAAAVRMVGLLFPLCGVAHRAALSAALDEPAVPQEGLVAEHMVARGFRLALDVPALMGLPERPQALVALRKAAAAADGFRAATAALDALGEGFTDPDCGFATFEARVRAGGGPVARLLADALARGPNFGAVPVPLRRPDAAHFDIALRRKGFGSRPTFEGAPAEIGPLAEAAPSPLLEAITDRFGPGHLARLVASLTIRPAQGPTRSGATGVAPTSRGPLAYRAVAEAGAVISIASVAPTEWHFHPQGALAQALATARPGENPERTIRLLAFGLDPCVPLAVSLTAPEPAHA